MKNSKILIVICLLINSIVLAQVGIGTTSPDNSAMLDINVSSLNANEKKGLLIPRITSTERDNISAPVDGLQIYNTTNKTLDIFTDGAWKSFSYESNPNANLSNLVYVYTMGDLPTPAGGNITLDETKMYVFSGIVDIGSNYITLNGAGLRGTDPQKDGVMSSTTGAVLRSTNKSIFMQNLTVIPTAGSAYDFSDNTGLNFCNIFSGCSVVGNEVGQFSGFMAITLIQNYWNVSKGIKVTGDVGKFTASYCFIVGVNSGSGVEFLAGLTADDIDMSNNYFIYNGQTGIKVNGGSIDRGILTSNMFRGVATPLDGITSFSNGWSMRQNTNISDSRAFSFIYFNDNLTATALPTSGTFYKISGATTVVNEKRFTASSNRITYNNVIPIVAKVSVVLGAKSPANNSDFSIAIAKNGVVINEPVASMGTATNNQAFQITLNTELEMNTGDYIEVFMRSNNSNVSSIVVQEMQFRVTD